MRGRAAPTQSANCGRLTPCPCIDSGGTGALAISLIAVDIGIKVLLYIYCVRYAKRSAIAAALAQDHRNDVLVNSVALTTSILGTPRPTQAMLPRALTTL